VTGVKQVWTYAQLLAEVETAAGLLRDLGVKKGDGVMIYFPAGASLRGYARSCAAAYVPASSLPVRATCRDKRPALTSGLPCEQS